MACVTYEGGVAVCSAPQNVVRRRFLNCWNCETKRRVAQVYQGVWYGDHFYCCHCGDGWGEGETMPRPFARGWREKAIIRAREYWDSAVSKTEWDAYWKADLNSCFATEPVEDAVADL